MICKAKYTGLYPALGVIKGTTYTLELRTYNSEHGAPYLWVRIEELPAYMMPYESMLALLMDWEFTVQSRDDEAPYVNHLSLVDAWLSVYAPVPEPAALPA